MYVYIVTLNMVWRQNNKKFNKNVFCFVFFSHRSVVSLINAQRDLYRFSHMTITCSTLYLIKHCNEMCFDMFFLDDVIAIIIVIFGLLDLETDVMGARHCYVPSFTKWVVGF